MWGTLSGEGGGRGGWAGKQAFVVDVEDEMDEDMTAVRQGQGGRRKGDVRVPVCDG
jgi:hypothetical protein